VTERGTARHRAPNRAITPLTTISTGLSRSVGDHAEALGRSGAAIAMSSGLVASMALPANAVGQPAIVPPRTPQTASLPALPVSALAASLVGGTLSRAQLTAPSGVEVSFDAGGLTASAPASSRAAVRAEREAARRVAVQQAAGVATPTSVVESVAASSAANSGATSAATRDAVVAVAKLSAARKAAAKLVEAKRAAKVAAAKRAAEKAAAKKAAAEKAIAAKASTTAAASTTKKAATVVAGARGSAVVALAARYIGVMYRMGGTTPRGFDCSGLVQYVYKQVGISLPRTAQAQMNATTPIPASQAKHGDLVFYISGGYAYHMGIVTSSGRMIDSPRTGKSVQERAMFAGTKVYRRVTR